MLKMVCNDGEWRIIFDIKFHWYLWVWIYSCFYFNRLLSIEFPFHRVFWLHIFSAICQAFSNPWISPYIPHAYNIEDVNKWIYTSSWQFLCLHSMGQVHTKENTPQQKMVPNLGPLVARHFQYLAIDTTAHIQQLILCPAINIPASIQCSTTWPRVEWWVLCFPTKLATTGQIWISQPCDSCGTTSWPTITYNTDGQKGTGEEDSAWNGALEEYRYPFINQGGRGVPHSNLWRNIP